MSDAESEARKLISVGYRKKHVGIDSKICGAIFEDMLFERILELRKASLALYFICSKVIRGTSELPEFLSYGLCLLLQYIRPYPFSDAIHKSFPSSDRCLVAWLICKVSSRFCNVVEGSSDFRLSEMFQFIPSGLLIFPLRPTKKSTRCNLASK